MERVKKVSSPDQALSTTEVHWIPKPASSFVREIDRMKPWNHETMQPDVFSMSQRWIGWNHETTKPRNHETWRLLNVPEMDWMKPRNHETTKPWNHVSWFHGVHGEISHETRNHETSGFVFKKGPWFGFLGTLTASLIQTNRFIIHHPLPALLVKFSIL